MSTPITYTIDAVPRSRAEAPSKPGWLRRAFYGLLAAREAQAHRYIVDYLSRLSNERLAELGYTDEQIRLLRVEGRLPELDAD